ncbi:MAG: hypothetical protein IT438_12845 [Phycisphaerales bacterium]|nr:hypothetical protein [Phycisphaerales bacterium]
MLDKFNYKPQPEGQKLINELVNDFLKHNPSAAILSRRMKSETGTRFADWIDHIQVGSSASIKKRLTECGFTLHPQPMADECYIHEGAMFPSVVLVSGKAVRIGVKVESVMDFLVAHNINEGDIHGEPGGQFRMATAFKGADGFDMFIVERHGYRGFAAPRFDAAKAARAAWHGEVLKRRRREFDNDAEGFRETTRLVDAAIADLGADWTCDLFFAAERCYWMRRNRAGQVQFARQQKLGLGWANHDHHTYRSSREHFTRLVALWEKLGFTCRERFYAGHEAQWGAQVMEQAATGITTFNDVDMSPEELLGDFSHEGFAQSRDRLGTVGLWCGLHGEAVLQAGMHHLEAQFDWQALVEQLEQNAHIRTMAPFTTFKYLRQAFTEGETWQVSEKRLQKLVAARLISTEQASMFRQEGALGSHLENLERNDGFKGFNQEGVSDIIARTDPRKHAKMHAVGA